MAAGNKLSRGAIAGIVVAVLLASLLVAGIVIVPRVVASRIAEAGTKRGLRIEYTGFSLGLGSVTLEGVTISPAASAVFRLQAPQVIAEIAWFQPKSVRIPSATLKLEGSIAKVQRAFEAIRLADQKVPMRERLPLVLEAGKLTWSGFAGGIGEIRIDAIKLTTHPAEEKIEAEVAKGQVSVLLATVGPMSGRITRKGKVLDVELRLPEDAGTGRVFFHRDEDGDEVRLEAEGLRPGGLVDLPLLDLPKKASVDGKLTFARSADGAVSAKGKLAAKGLVLPKIPVGPASLSLGTTLSVDLELSPKKRPGDAKIDKATATFTLGGKPRTVKVTGDVSVGEDLDGPYAVDLAWDLGPIPCSDLASELVGGAVGGLGGLVAGGLAGQAVTGNLSVSGTIKGNPTRPAKLQKATHVKEGCKVEVPGGKFFGE